MNIFQNLDKTLIVDADSIVFIACYNAAKDTLSEEFFNTELEHSTEVIRLAGDYAKAHVLNIQEVTGCEAVECYFTAGKCFRYDVDAEYKANRKKTNYVLGLKEVKEYLHSQFDGEISTEYEADDICYYRGMQENTLVSCIDKDISGQLPYATYNFRKNVYIEPQEDPKKFVWLQMIIGDNADNIKGIRGIGAVGATKYLADVEDYRTAVLELYTEKGRRDDFIKNLNLLDMALLQDDMSIKLHKELEDETV
jgi:5'-3' exonuclease